MNYLFLIPGNGFGGLEQQMLKRAEDAIERGSHSIILAEYGSDIYNYAEKNSLELEQIKIRIDYADPIAIWTIEKCIKKYSIDICIVGSTRYLSLVIAAVKIASTKTSVILYQQMLSGLNKKDFFHIWVYKNLNGAIVLTKRMKTDIINTTVIKPDKVETIPYGIKSKNFAPAIFDKDISRAKFGLPQDKIIIGSIARFEKTKDPTAILNALNILKDDRFYAVFAGSVFPEHREYFAYFDQLIDDFNLRKNVKVLGFIQNIAELVNSFDIFILPTNSETFGMVLLEAMASHVPVIASDGGGVPEIITNNENGLLFSHGDYNTLAEHINLLTEKLDLRDKFILNGCNKVEREYNYKIQTGKFFEFCKKIHLANNK